MVIGWIYTTLAGDTFDMIALDFYNDEFKAGELLRANPEHSGVLAFPAGVELNIPILEDMPAETLPPWRR